MKRPSVRRTLHPEPPRGDVTEGEGRHNSVFLRGLSLGALIGGAIAGSTIWDRRRARRERVDETGAPSKSEDAGNA